MFDQILVAIDNSVGSKQIFDRALSLAKAHGGNLILLQVLSVEESALLKSTETQVYV